MAQGERMLMIKGMKVGNVWPPQTFFDLACRVRPPLFHWDGQASRSLVVCRVESERQCHRSPSRLQPSVVPNTSVSSRTAERALGSPLRGFIRRVSDLLDELSAFCENWPGSNTPGMQRRRKRVRGKFPRRHAGWAQCFLSPRRRPIRIAARTHVSIPS